MWACSTFHLLFVTSSSNGRYKRRTLKPEPLECTVKLEKVQNHEWEQCSHLVACLCTGAKNNMERELLKGTGHYW